MVISSPAESFDSSVPLYQPHNVDTTATFRFLSHVNEKFQLNLRSYQDLFNWSTKNVHLFWSSVWDVVQVIGTKGDSVVDHNALPVANPPWFPDASLNWAENMLHCRSDTKIALIHTTEPTANNPIPAFRQCTYLQLYNLVADVVSALLYHGFKPGDRVASYSSNTIENLAACLATAAIGGIWVAAAADFGAQGVLERLEQVQPKFLFAVDAVAYNGKVHPHLSKLKTLLGGLEKHHVRPKVIVINTSLSEPGRTQERADEWQEWDSFLADGQASKLGRSSSGEVEWYRSSFDRPLWILFSSGTTGRPKAIVHRAGGMLLQAKKEFVIMGDLKPHDVFFYYTTTGWMMWNFLISGLSVGCTLVLYDGSPLKDPGILWKFVDTLRITIFGTSAKYIDQLAKTYRPRENHDLRSLRQIYSTGSPLAPALYDYVYNHIHADVLLGSITGGTDICSLFAGMCTALPVYRGEIQCRMLGMAIESYSSAGKPCAPGEAGELVCVKPFPCMPLGFWPLRVTERKATFNLQKVGSTRRILPILMESGVNHGDHIMITPSRRGNGGGVVMLGRSDGVLNPGGIRFGSAELYDVIESCFSGSSTEHRIVDCLVVGQQIEGGTDERVILFVKLPDGVTFSTTFEDKIKAEIRSRRSARHVPAKIIQVYDIPYTVNGKRVEVLVKKIINGAPLSTVNPATLSNPECLSFYLDIGNSLRAEAGR